MTEPVTGQGILTHPGLDQGLDIGFDHGSVSVLTPEIACLQGLDQDKLFLNLTFHDILLRAFRPIITIKSQELASIQEFGQVNSKDVLRPSQNLSLKTQISLKINTKTEPRDNLPPPLQHCERTETGENIISHLTTHAGGNNRP